MEKFSVLAFFQALLIISVFLIISYSVKKILLKNIILPASLLAGILALLAGPEVLGSKISSVPVLEDIVSVGLIPEKTLQIWKEMPEYLISIVFACLFLGRRIPTTKKIIKNSLPNLTFGYTLALGQYLVGLLIALLVLKPFFNMDILSGTLIAIGFQGGHGTIAGLKSSFRELGFSNGSDLGLGIATLGIVSAIIFGSIMANLSSGHGEDDMQMADKEEPIKIKRVSMTLQLAFIGSSITLGWLVLQSLKGIEALMLKENQDGFISYIPLFPVAMLTGLMVQKLAEKLGFAKLISREHIRFISNLSLDLLIVAALGGLSVTSLARDIYPLLILTGTGIIYNLVIYFLLAKKLFGRDWKVRGLGELGQSMGTTAIGLILIKGKGRGSKAITRSFSYKQPFYEPIVGGGLITGLALPLIDRFGPWPFLASMALLLLTVWIVTRIILH